MQAEPDERLDLDLETAMRALIVGLAFALAGLSGGAHAEPGTPEGWISVANPGGSQVPYSLSYIATVEGMFANAGDWRLVIKRGCRPDGTNCDATIVYDSSDYPGGTAFEAPGIIRPGDRVTGTLRALGTTMAFGSATGCPGTTNCV